MTTPPPSPGSFDPPTTRSIRVTEAVGGGRFLLLEMLGHGGMGVVWKAMDQKLREEVALKFLPASVRIDPTSLEDLRRETTRTRRLSHRNIVQVYDLHDTPGEDPFISMEFVNGRTLAQERASYPGHVLPWDYLSPYLAQLCDALAYAHEEKVIHRDLKPSNILLDIDRSRIKLVDFGIARLVSETVARVTGRQPMTGTTVYMSQQQLDGYPPTPADDLYSLGATLYELLTSKPPFYAGEVAYQIRYGDVAPPTERLAEFKINNRIPPQVEDAVLACLARDPAKRPRSPRELAEMLGLVAAEPKPTPAKPRSRSPRREKSVPSTTARSPETDTATARTPGTTTRPTAPDDEALEASPPEVEVVESVPAARSAPTPAPTRATAKRTAPIAQPPPSVLEPPLVPRPPRRRLGRLVFLFLFLAGLVAALVWVHVPPFQSQTTPAEPVPLYAFTLDWLRSVTGFPTPSAPAPASPQSSIAAQAPSPTPPAIVVATPPPVATEPPPSATPKPVTVPATDAGPAPAVVTSGEPSAAASPPPVAAAPEPQAARPAAVASWPGLGEAYTNSLGMEFVPVAGTRVLFSRWETRIQDYTNYLGALFTEASQPPWSRLVADLHPRVFGQAQDGTHPVVMVSWSNASEFCTWLTQQEQALNRIRPDQRYRLPTDLEWSAAVGLTNEPGKTPEDRLRRGRSTQYVWGNSEWPPPTGNFRGGEINKSASSGPIARYTDRHPWTAPVGSYGLNALGLADLAGNVWEWCEDGYSAGDRSLRVLRGASWDTALPRECRANHRNPMAAGIRSRDVGFRCVLVVEATPTP